VNEHISAGFEMNPVLGTIITVLMRSYDGLPYHLKSCFYICPSFVKTTGLDVHAWHVGGVQRVTQGRCVEGLERK
jgi:hypothetical protein